MPTPTIGPLLTIPLIGWMIYRRIRRHFGRQPFRTNWLVFRLVLLCLVTAGLLFLAFAVPAFALAIYGGLLVGALIGVVNLRLTRFEWAPDGDFYYPHPYIGAALSLLLVARLAYRYTALGGGMPGTNAHPLPLQQQSPLTYGLLGLLIGYYVAYAIGLLIVRNRHHRL